MLRVFATIVLPLVAPTAIYLLWMWIANRFVVGAPPGVGGGRGLPWLWLAGTGIVLLASVLVFVTVHSGTSTPSTYVPPRWEDGHIVPGHFEPKP